MIFCTNCDNSLKEETRTSKALKNRSASMNSSRKLNGDYTKRNVKSIVLVMEQ